MIRPTGNFERLNAPPPANETGWSSIMSCLAISVWCGLVAGLLEVGIVVARKHSIDPNHLYGTSRHFVWLIPIANVCILIAVGAEHFATVTGGEGLVDSDRGVSGLTKWDERKCVDAPLYIGDRAVRLTVGGRVDALLDETN